MPYSHSKYTFRCIFKFYCMCEWCMCVWGVNEHATVFVYNSQLCEVSSLLPPLCEFWRSHLGCQASMACAFILLPHLPFLCRQDPLLTRSLQPWLVSKPPGFIWIHFPREGVAGISHHAQLLPGAGEPNSGPHGCTLLSCFPNLFFIFFYAKL